MQNAPCKNCLERFIACSDKCPKDARGEYGYKAWLADVHKAKAQTEERKHRDREAFLRSEECTWKNRKMGVPK